MRAVVLWGPVVAWMALLFKLSSGPIPDEVSVIPDWITHGGGYLVLAVLACRALAGGILRPVTARVAFLAVVLSVAYGVTDEFLQSVVPGRQPDPWDILKDLGGAAVGAAASAWPRGAAGPRRRAE